MGQAEIFGPEERVELIDGDVIDVPRLSSQCTGTIDHLAKLLWSAAGDRAQLRVRNPESLKLTRYRNPARGAYTLVEQPDLDIPIDVDALPRVRVTLRPLFAHVRA
jgi:hypothetical protein